VDFKPKLVRRNKEGHFILIKVLIHQEEITIINFHASNVGIPNFIKHTLRVLKSQINPNTVVVGDFNSPLSPIDRSSRQKFNKDILELTDTIHLMELADVYRVFHPASVQ
jgi:endonuclease/exonuclease/phosphatase (EEP) superfamily protein YafD